MDLLHERDRGPSTEKIPLDSRPPLGWPHQDLLTEKNRLPYVSSLVDRGSCISFVFLDLAHVWSYSCWLSVSLVFPRDFPRVLPRVLCVPRRILSKSERSAPRVPPYIILVSWATLITNLEPLPPFSSLLLLDFVLNSKIPTKNSPNFFVICW